MGNAHDLPYSLPYSLPYNLFMNAFSDSCIEWDHMKDLIYRIRLIPEYTKKF